MKQKLMVICGGQSSEHLVSRMSCTSVMNNLNKEKYEVILTGIDKDGNWYELNQDQDNLADENWLVGSHPIEDIFSLLKQQDVILPVLHGAYGEDGTIQGLFELAGVPYVGCRVLGSSVSMDKIYTKKILETAHIPQVKSLYALVVALANDDDVYEKTLSNIKSVKARGANVILVTNKNVTPDPEIYDHIIQIPKTIAELSASLSIVPMQLLAYYIGVYRGCDIDMPRNLAKSVTVE